jgi:hypothetical protein
LEWRGLERQRERGGVEWSGVERKGEIIDGATGMRRGLKELTDTKGMLGLLKTTTNKAGKSAVTVSK